MKQIDNQLVELVNLFYQYAQENKEVSISDFCKHYLATQKMEEILNENTVSLQPQDFVIEGYLGKLLGRLSRFMSLELKNLAEKVEMDTVEEIWYLAAMFELKNPTKSDIIYHIISEFSSGIAVINRLLSKNYLEEYPDSLDKRAKRLKITDKGKEKLFFCFEQLQNMSKEIFINLTTIEKNILYQILSKLEKFHTQKYESNKQKLYP